MGWWRARPCSRTISPTGCTAKRSPTSSGKISSRSSSPERSSDDVEELKRDPRVDLRHSGSDWITVAFSSPDDGVFVLELIEEAAAAHRRVSPLSGPPPGPSWSAAAVSTSCWGSLQPAQDVRIGALGWNQPPSAGKNHPMANLLCPIPDVWGRRSRPAALPRRTAISEAVEE
jgi:hypothetical protein